MQVIPVLDLMGGAVVHARRGERTTYRPIEAPRAAGSSAPAAVAHALFAHRWVDGGTLGYVADLDALMHGPAQLDAVAALLRDGPAVRWWIDAGFRDAEAARRWHGALAQCAGAEAAHRASPVFATEALADARALHGVRVEWPDAPISLDRRAGRWLGAPDVVDAARRLDGDGLTLLAMTLDAVGADAGPDLASMAALRAQAPSARRIGAGGVRGADDLVAAAHAGAAGWLVASALHGPDPA